MAYATATEHDLQTAGPHEQTKHLREQAHCLIEMLRTAKAETLARLESESREDAFASVRGETSFDLAIADAEHTRDVLDRALERAHS